MRYYLMAIVGMLVAFIIGIIMKEELQVPGVVVYIVIIVAGIKIWDWARGKAKK